MNADRFPDLNGGPRGGGAWSAEETDLVLERCLRRIRGWCLPPHWAKRDWLEEVAAQAQADAWRAEQDFDPARGVPIARFIYSRVMGGVLTRYRQEWRYGARTSSAFGEANDEPNGCSSDPSDVFANEDSLNYALLQLAESDKAFIETILSGRSTETQIADESGMTRQAVNKRKRKIIRFLRNRILVGTALPEPGFVLENGRPS